jgi:Leucine-rich repeat (LRR) protein
MFYLLKNPLFAVSGFASLFLASCKPQSTSSELSAAATPEATPQVQQKQQADVITSVRQLTAGEWFAKKNISSEEARTVDAIIDSLKVTEQRDGTPDNLARWAEKNLQVLSLDYQKLSNISPILAFKNISTLSIVGNSFGQPQVDELVRGLPKLKNLLTDQGINCKANPKVICLK